MFNRIRMFQAAGIIGLMTIGLCASAGRAAQRDPSTNAIAMAELGRKLFFDPSLSASGKLSCSTCHQPQYAYGPAPKKALAIGGPHMDRPGTRAVPSLRYLNQVPQFSENVPLNDGGVGPTGGLTWDGRAASLHDQARIPLLAPNEMANRNETAVVEKLRRGAQAERFKTLFGADVFARKEFVFEQVLAALAAFQQTPAEFYPFTSKYDAYLRGEVQLTEQEQRGLEVFNHPGRGNCANCHLSKSVDGSPPIFTDFEFDNVGVPRNLSIVANRNPQYYDMGLCGPSRIDLAAHTPYCGLFRTPGLRNVALRDSFFHNGVFGSLREVLQFYQQRDVLPWKWYPRRPDGKVDKANDLPDALRRNLNIDPPFMGRFGGQLGAISDADIDDLIAFLGTLTDGYQLPASQHASGVPRSGAGDSAAVNSGG